MNHQDYSREDLSLPPEEKEYKCTKCGATAHYECGSCKEKVCLEHWVPNVGGKCTECFMPSEEDDTIYE